MTKPVPRSEKDIQKTASASDQYYKKMSLAKIELKNVSTKIVKRCDPPLHRLFRKIGIRIKPPIYSSFHANLLTFLTMNAVLLSLLMWVITWLGRGMSVQTTIFMAILYLLMPIWTAYDIHCYAKKLTLSKWEDL